MQDDPQLVGRLERKLDDRADARAVPLDLNHVMVLLVGLDALAATWGPAWRPR